VTFYENVEVGPPTKSNRGPLMKLLRRWSRLSFVLIGCSETGTVSVRLVLSTCIPVRRFCTGVRTLQFVNSLVQLMFCEHAPSHYRALLTSDRYHTILSSYRSVDTQTLHGNVHHVDHVPNGPTNSSALTTMFPLRLCGASYWSRSLESDATVRTDYALTTTTTIQYCLVIGKHVREQLA